MNAHEKKILNFLNDVYLTTKDDYTKVTLQSFIKKHRVSDRYGKILKENFLHSKPSGQHNGSRLYKWMSIKPNLKMVNKAITEVKNNNYKSMNYTLVNINNNSKKQIIMDAQQKKVLNFLNELYDLTKDDYVFLSLSKLIKKHKLFSGYSVIVRGNLVEYKVLPNHTSFFIYKWKTIKPNLKMVDRLIKEVGDYSRGASSKNRVKTHTSLLKGNVENRLAFVKELRDVCLTKYAEMPTGSIVTMRDKHNVDINFTNFLFSNKYFLRKMAYNNEIGVNCYIYRWNGTRSSMQLKKLIIKAGNNSLEGKEPSKNIETKIVNTKPKKLEPIKEIKSDTHREEVIKEYRSKSISILWGLIKIKY